MSNRINVIKGSTLKVLLNWSYPSDPTVKLQNIDFGVTFHAKSFVHFDKDDLYEEIPAVGDHNFYAYINTVDIGSGILRMRLRAEIPDSNAPGGVKVDVSEFVTNVFIQE